MKPFCYSNDDDLWWGIAWCFSNVWKVSTCQKTTLALWYFHSLFLLHTHGIINQHQHHQNKSDFINKYTLLLALFIFRLNIKKDLLSLSIFRSKRANERGRPTKAKSFYHRVRFSHFWRRNQGKEQKICFE